MSCRFAFASQSDRSLETVRTEACCDNVPLCVGQAVTACAAQVRPFQVHLTEISKPIFRHIGPGHYEGDDILEAPLHSCNAPLRCPQQGHSWGQCHIHGVASCRQKCTTLQQPSAQLSSSNGPPPNWLSPTVLLPLLLPFCRGLATRRM